jgi:3-dehydroquinate synthase
MRQVHVALGSRSYDILVSRWLLPELGSHCRRLGFGRRCALLTDSRVGPLHGRVALRSLRQAGFDPVLVSVPAGERAKSIRHLADCYDQLAVHRLERKSFLVALGGGVVGDLAGFVAASYLRGIPFVQVPTTLVAQVDSSVGGKTGVNLAAGKNLVGAFWQPRLVLCDLETLKTLPDREYRSGLAEVIKYGIICDPTLFRRIEQRMPAILQMDSLELAWVVARCCTIKAEIVSQDETESGLRAILNFGHTVGHALEAITRYGRYLHGEAIAIGQMIAARISQQLLGLPPADVERMERLFKSANLPVTIQFSKDQLQRLCAAMKLDKKVAGGQIQFVLAERLGRVRFGQSVPWSLLITILNAPSGLRDAPRCRRVAPTCLR